MVVHTSLLLFCHPALTPPLIPVWFSGPLHCLHCSCQSHNHLLAAAAAADEEDFFFFFSLSKFISIYKITFFFFSFCLIMIFAKFCSTLLTSLSLLAFLFPFWGTFHRNGVWVGGNCHFPV